MFSSYALPELGRASTTNVNKLTNFEYASLFSSTEYCPLSENYGSSGAATTKSHFLATDDGVSSSVSPRNCQEMRSLCKDDSNNGGSKTTDTIVAEVVCDNASAVGIGFNAKRAVRNGRAGEP